MKRFLIMMLGDGEELLDFGIIGEIDKGGEVEVDRLIRKAGRWNGVVKYFNDSTLYNVYLIRAGENRKQVLADLNAKELYKDRVQGYNKANGEL